MVMEIHPCVKCFQDLLRPLKVSNLLVIWNVKPYSLVNRYQQSGRWSQQVPSDVGASTPDYMVSNIVCIHHGENLQSHTAFI
jgi:hypothetical protein